jgi:DNA polymerase-3 subunit delta
MSAYIFLGPELGKKQDAIAAVRKNYPGHEETVFYAGETSVSAIADILQNHSLFAEARIIIVKNADVIKKKEEIDLLASCIKNIEKNTSLILLSDEIRLAAGLDTAVPQANRQVFYELFEREKAEWLRNFFKREGFNIDKDGIDTILEMVENNTEALKRECSRLICFLQAEVLPQTGVSPETGVSPKVLPPKDRPVNAGDIEKWLSHNREESTFTLFSRVAAGDLSKSLESLQTMLAAKESAQGILAGLAWCFRKLGDYLALLEVSRLQGTGVNNFELKKIGLSAPKTKDDYAAAARRYSADDVGKCLALTAECDLLLRSPAAAMENLLMDRYILRLIRLGAFQ